jgi:hypothetical protein
MICVNAPIFLYLFDFQIKKLDPIQVAPVMINALFVCATSQTRKACINVVTHFALPVLMKHLHIRRNVQFVPRFMVH